MAPEVLPTPDKYSAVWVSHSSISDFLKCPRGYYLRNIYKDPMTGHKMTIMSPPLALGQASHEVIESLAILPVNERLKIPLAKRLEPAWEKVAGKKGGFKTEAIEKEYRDRATQMLNSLEKNPGPILNKAVKIKTGSLNLPYYFLSKEENIILCGKIDWLEYLPATDSIHVIDFKTGRIEEREGSLQLPIYYLLGSNTQKRIISKASYWYLWGEIGLKEKKLPDMDEAHEKVLSVARRVKLARKLKHFTCPDKGCRYCLPYERILRGEAEKVSVSETGQDIYILPN